MRKEEYVMKKLFIKKCGFWIIILMICVTAISSPVQAANLNNKKAHRAYTKQLKKDKKELGLNKLEYAYKDLDGDGIDELITYPGFDHYAECIYTYRNGKVKEVVATNMGDFEKYYSKNKILYGSRVNIYNFDSTYYEYFKFKNGKLVRKAYKVETMTYKNGKSLSKYKYYVNEKKVTKKKYDSYVKQLLKKDKARYFKKLKWKKC